MDADLHAQMLAALRARRGKPQTWDHAWRSMVARYGEEAATEAYHHAREYLKETRS